jgi:hypothetical protein
MFNMKNSVFCQYSAFGFVLFIQQKVNVSLYNNHCLQTMFSASYELSLYVKGRLFEGLSELK